MATWKCTVFGAGWCFMALNTVLVLQGSNYDTALQCIFDQVQVNDIGKTNLNYTLDTFSRMKRDTSDLYQSIRIKAIVQDLDQFMDTIQVLRLETIIGGAISVIRKLFSVYPVSGPLIMSRSETACRQVYLDGPNVGKCATISPAYIGEECLDNFLIPDDHLLGLWTWDATNLEPLVTHYSTGSGISDTDTVLYVKAEHTDRCNSGQIVAYASYCKLDQFNRPIAGVINFCPNPLLDDLYDEDKFVLLALHEILHVLGFSSSLFDKFQECRVCGDGLDCEPRDDVVVTDSKDQPRLHTPAVSAAAQAHFGCHDPNLGAPLENLVGSGFSSHWETRHMYGSLMAPIIDQPRSTFLDNLTLAVFKDSGWYKVNYKFADDFVWGREQGCDFGCPELCVSNFSDFFCNDSSSGCDYLLLNKGTCSTNDYLDGCRVFRAETNSQCTFPVSSEAENNAHNVSEEITGSDSRCLLSNAVPQGTLSPSSLSGNCYSTRCSNTTDSYEVRLANSEWVECPPGTVIHIPGYDGEVYCSPVGVICRNYSSLLSLIDPVCLACTSTAATTLSQTSGMLSFAEVNLSLQFNSLDYSEVDEEAEVSMFEGTVKESIATVTLLPEDRIQVRDIRRGSVVVIVYFTEATVDSDVSAQNAYVTLSSAVLSGQFCIKYNQFNYTAASVSLIDISTSAIPQQSSSSTTSDVTPTGGESTTNITSQIVIGVVALLAILLLMSILVATCLWKKNKLSSLVSPTPDTTNKEGASPGNVYVVGKGD